jgi:hypothetical protein
VGVWALDIAIYVYSFTEVILRVKALAERLFAYNSSDELLTKYAQVVVQKNAVIMVKYYCDTSQVSVDTKALRHRTLYTVQIALCLRDGMRVQ